MLNEIFIVDTAISSFNNAALFYPYFFAVGILCLPLFYVMYLYGQDILARFKWNKDPDRKIGFCSVLCLVLWLLLCGGNYAVIRDGISLLSVAIAIVLFVSMIYVTSQAKQLKYLTFFKDKRLKWLAFFVLVLFSVLSAKPDLYSILLQLSAVFCGIIVGSRLHKNMPSMFISTFVFVIMTILILMQPEYFRFGQLGNLTFVHLISLVITGFFAVTFFASKYTNAHSKIYASAYVKLKWLCRIVSVLGLILFALTESVPVYIGLLFIMYLSEILTIYHSKKKPEGISKYSWAMFLVSCGVVMVCPVISCLGILYMSQIEGDTKTKDFIRLL